MSSDTLTKKARTMRTLYRLTLGILLLLPAIQALAGLTLYPTRIVFDGNQRSAQLELINNGTESATYRISLVNRRMSETGAFSDIDEPLPGEQSAEDLLRYSPRQVTLDPGKGQTVRVMVRKPANLITGEYRSHLLFAKQPKARGRTSIETRDAHGAHEIEIKLTALVGASIPVIVRHGNTNATVAMTHLDLSQTADKSPTLAMHIERSGSQSVYGDLTVIFTPRGGSDQVLARANGVAVYTPNSLRRASIKLDQPDGLQLGNGILRVIYREQAEDGGALLAEAVLRLP